MVLSGCATPDRFEGALPVRNQHPVQLTVLRLEPGTARTLPAGEAEAGLRMEYTSVFLRGSTATDSFRMDGELFRTALAANYGLTDTLQLEFRLPVIHTSGGFLDHVIEEWHDVIGSRESGRRRVADNGFEIQASRQGLTAYSMEETSLALMDIPIGLAWQFLRPTEETPVALTLRGAVELPTGDPDDGFGNGGLDVSVGAYGDLQLGRFHFAAHAGYTFAHTPDRARRAGVDFGDVAFGGLAVEAALTESTVAIAQVDWDQSVLRQLRGVHTEESQALLWIGFRSRWTDSLAVEIGFGEDLVRKVSPDFTAYLGIRYGNPP